MNLDKLTMDELISLRNEIDGRIYGYTDGYLYICSVRQFGSVWEERPNSLYALKELCNSYYGDNGIVDVYTNNPNLEFPEMEFYNYGDVNYIKSEDDYVFLFEFSRVRKYRGIAAKEIKNKNLLDTKYLKLLGNYYGLFQ